MLLTNVTEVIKYTFKSDGTHIQAKSTLWKLVDQTTDSLTFKNDFNGELETIKTEELGDFLITEDLQATVWQVRKYASSLQTTFNYIRKVIVTSKDYDHSQDAYPLWYAAEYTYSPL